MKISTFIPVLLLLLTSLGFAQPTLSVSDVPADRYSQWLQEKDELWSKELNELRAFSPGEVENLNALRKTIAENADRLQEAPDSSADVKKETHQLVFVLESRLESLYVNLERATGPVLVYNL